MDQTSLNTRLHFTARPAGQSTAAGLGRQVGTKIMKVIRWLLILAMCQRCIAAENTNIIFLGEWSKPVPLRNEHSHDQAIRGRLLILQGLEPAYGGPETTNGAMTFVELQDVTEASGEGIELYFAVTNLHCELSDATGKLIPEPGGAWSGRGPFSPRWVNLPYNSAIRLFVNGGRMDPLAVYPSGEPGIHWSIRKNGTNTYYLSGTLSISARTNYTGPPEFRDTLYFDEYRATLKFPKTKIMWSNN